MVEARSQAVSRARWGRARASPRVRRAKVRARACGVVVSVLRPGSAELRAGSQRSRRVAEGAAEAGDGGGAAEPAQQQVGGRVVAELDGCGAEFGDGQGPGAAGDGGVAGVGDVRVGVVDPGREVVPGAQQGGDGERLEDRAERERLVRAVPDRRAAAGVVGEDAQPGSVLVLQLPEGVGELAGGGGGGGEGAGEGGGAGCGEQVAAGGARVHRWPPRGGAGRPVVHRQEGAPAPAAEEGGRGEVGLPGRAELSESAGPGRGWGWGGQLKGRRRTEALPWDWVAPVRSWAGALPRAGQTSRVTVPLARLVSGAPVVDWRPAAVAL